MKEYPSIPSTTDLLRRSEDYLGRPCIAFDKLDGSNIRAEWDRKRGWHLFGSRKRLLRTTSRYLSQARGVILESYAEPLERVFRDTPELGRVDQVTAYFELVGPHSFAGLHSPADLGVADNPLRVVLIDVNIHRRGLMSAEDFLHHFGHLELPRVVYRGVLTGEVIEQTRAGAFDTNEGVVCKGGEGHGRWMAKIKTYAYLQGLKDFFQGSWQEYWE